MDEQDLEKVINGVSEELQSYWGETDDVDEDHDEIKEILGNLSEEVKKLRRNYQALRKVLEETTPKLLEKIDSKANSIKGIEDV